MYKETAYFKKYICLLLGAIIAHVLFCADSPLLYKGEINLTIILGSLIFSITGMVASIIVFVPMLYALTKKYSDKNSLKMFSLKNITKALWVGAGIRFFLFFK